MASEVRRFGAAAVFPSTLVVLASDYDALAAENARLRAELAEVKGREAVAYISAKSIERLSDPRIHGTASAIERKPTNDFVPFWLAPPASPDVEGLVKALENARLFIRNGIDLGYIRMPDSDTPDPAHDTLPMIDTALSTWRQAQVRP